MLVHSCYCISPSRVNNSSCSIPVKIKYKLLTPVIWDRSCLYGNSLLLEKYKHFREIRPQIVGLVSHSLCPGLDWMGNTQFLLLEVEPEFIAS